MQYRTSRRIQMQNRGIQSCCKHGMSLNFLNFMQQKLVALLLHQLYAVVADHINAFVE